MTTLVADTPAAPSTWPLRPPSRLAQEITGRTYLSHSQLSLMRACPKRFEMLYIQKARPDFVAATLLFGGAMHRSLELWFRASLEGLTVTHAALLSAFHDAWKNDRSKSGDDIPIRFNKSENIDTIHAMADRMLRAFLDSPLAQPKGAILGIEEELRVVLDPQLPDLLAKVDLMTQTEGSLHVVDFKTSRSRWTEEKALQSGDQLVLYGITVRKMSRFLDLPVRLHFGVLTKHKTPQIQLLAVPTDEGRVQAMKESVAQVWQAIQSGNFYPSPSAMNCITCQFKSRCPIFAGH